MHHLEPLPRQEPHAIDHIEYHASINHELFKKRSLDLLAVELGKQPATGYPSQRLNHQFSTIPFDGPWNTHPDEPIEATQQTHPWTKDMLKNPNIGVVTGRGMFYEFGANNTADIAVTVRTCGELAILLVQRNSGSWALPGGFVDQNESSFSAAVRELCEETDFQLNQLEYHSTLAYRGPVADVRMTAHAWPETSLYSVRLLNDYVPMHKVSIPYPVNDEGVKAACWFGSKELPEVMFGSHKLMAQIALGQSLEI